MLVRDPSSGEVIDVQSPPRQRPRGRRGQPVRGSFSAPVTLRCLYIDGTEVGTFRYWIEAVTLLRAHGFSTKESVAALYRLNSDGDRVFVERGGKP